MQYYFNQGFKMSILKNTLFKAKPKDEKNEVIKMILASEPIAKGQTLKIGQSRYCEDRIIEKPYDINAVMLLPRELCLDPSWLDRLIVIRLNLQSPALGRFIDQIFSDKTIAFPFLQLPASTRHHHNKEGGLLAHSVEVAEIILNQSYDSGDERDIAVVAALLHDVGKVRTLGTNLITTQTGRMVSHDDLTLEVCASALKSLDESWPEAANTLRHVWTCATPGSRYGFQPNCSIAYKLRFADGESVRKYDASKIFKSHNKTDGLTWDDHQNCYIWRPVSETRLNNKRTLNDF